jgi:SAM-dependent methyltransferase
MTHSATHSIGPQAHALEPELRRARRRGDERSPEQLREHYLIERELADRLLRAPQSERAALYPQVYDELLRKVPHHPMLKAISETSAIARRRREVDQRLRFLRPFLTPETVFMEVGAGDCALALRAATMTRQVYAIDVSERITRNVVPPRNFKLILSDGCSIPLAAGSVDLAFSDQLMEHLHPRDAEEQLRNIARSLAPGGLYVCVTPNRLYGPTDVSGYFEEVARGFHLKEYSGREIRQLFRKVGFSRLQFCAGARGFFLRCPFAALTALEAGLAQLPQRLARRIAETAPMRAVLGLRIVAMKGA